MRAVLAALCVALLVVGAVASAVDAADVPLVVVTKTLREYVVVEKEPIDITVTVINYGKAPAYDVHVSDPAVLGEPVMTKDIEVLSPGENVTLTRKVLPVALGLLPVGAAEVTYALKLGDTQTLKAVSNEVRDEEALNYPAELERPVLTGMLSVVTRDEYDRLHTRYIREVIAYIFIGVLPALLPFLMYRTKQNEVDLLIRTSKKSA